MVQAKKATRAHEIDKNQWIVVIGYEPEKKTRGGVVTTIQAVTLFVTSSIEHARIKQMRAVLHTSALTSAEKQRVLDAENGAGNKTFKLAVSELKTVHQAWKVELLGEGKDPISAADVQPDQPHYLVGKSGRFKLPVFMNDRVRIIEVEKGTVVNGDHEGDLGVRYKDKDGQDASV